jgi:hypothetical protein
MAKNPNYIKPPLSRNCVWRSGPPPEIGWWPASCIRDIHMLRWWDGNNWSRYAFDREEAAVAAISAGEIWGKCTERIWWTDRWWPRVPPTGPAPDEQTDDHCGFYLETK